MTTDTIIPFVVNIPEPELEDLKSRLRMARCPDELADVDWDYGVPRGYVEDLVEYWRDGYDWERHGSHFATRDATDLLISDIRGFYRPLR